MQEFVVFVKRINNKKFKVGSKPKHEFANEAGIRGNAGSNGSKLLFFEIKGSAKAAKLKEKKLSSLGRMKLIEEIKKSNPEMFDLGQIFDNNNIHKELIY
jgi:hypothetical protein